MPVPQLIYLEDNLELALSHALEALRAPAGVIVFPTDTVYGLLAALDNGAGYRRIFELKQRSITQPLQILTTPESTLARDAGSALSTWPDWRERFRSGQATVVLDAGCFQALPKAVTAIQPGSVGVRIPAYEPLRLLLERLPRHSAWATSANRTGTAPAIEVDGLAQLFDGGFPPPALAVASRCPLPGSPSIVVRLQAGVIDELRR